MHVATAHVQERDVDQLFQLKAKRGSDEHHTHARSQDLNTGLVDEALSDVGVGQLAVGRCGDAGFATFKSALCEVRCMRQSLCTCLRFDRSKRTSSASVARPNATALAT